ncbi:hypothetical protein PR048_013117 [Dryococelus australis]|uniref:Uncharacterized protein n=1 Tax=Dryococelus australis TaxID=614101 RepID=A0ABQ9HR98_9NEOP|nr:hypothetical protein PR048_013117 [Dryococelus australis]
MTYNNGFGELKNFNHMRLCKCQLLQKIKIEDANNGDEMALYSKTQVHVRFASYYKRNKQNHIAKFCSSESEKRKSSSQRNEYKKDVSGINLGISRTNLDRKKVQSLGQSKLVAKASGSVYLNSYGENEVIVSEAGDLLHIPISTKLLFWYVYYLDGNLMVNVDLKNGIYLLSTVYRETKCHCYQSTSLFVALLTRALEQ